MKSKEIVEHCTEETLPQRWTITRVEEEAGQRMYVTTEILKKGKDPHSRFVVETIENLNKQLGSLDEPISRYKAHGRLRSQREIRNIKITREKQKRQIPHMLNALCGREKLPVKFIVTGGEIVGFKVELLNGIEPSLSADPQTSA